MKMTTDIIAAHQRRAMRRYFTAVLALALCTALACPAFAAGGGGGPVSGDAHPSAGDALCK